MKLKVNIASINESKWIKHANLKLNSHEHIDSYGNSENSYPTVKISLVFTYSKHALNNNIIVISTL